MEPGLASIYQLQLRELTSRVRAALVGPRATRSDVEAAFAEFARVCVPGAKLCSALLGDEEAGSGGGEVGVGARKLGRGRDHRRATSTVSVASAVSTLSMSMPSVKPWRGMGGKSEGSDAGSAHRAGTIGPDVRRKTVAVMGDHRDGWTGRDAVTDSVLPGIVDAESLAAVRDWKACLEDLVAAYNRFVTEADERVASDEVSTKPAGWGAP